MQPHGVEILLVEDNANDAELAIRTPNNTRRKSIISI